MSKGWNKEELAASVMAYIEMQRKERAGVSFIKKHYYDDLAKRFGRSAKAFEYRMQNISYVMTLLGRNWLSGLRPAQNVGVKVAAEIETEIARVEGKQNAPVVVFEIEAREAAKKKNLSTPEGNLHPTASQSTNTTYSRLASVKAWVLHHAQGVCEACGQAAPFCSPDGVPFLEIHHVRHLADGGSDTVTNSVAVCPNCHRALHYSNNAKEITLNLYKNISRLTPDKKHNEHHQ